MKTKDEVLKFVELKLDEFLKGLYSEIIVHCSKEFIRAYILLKFEQMYSKLYANKDDGVNPINVSYNSCVELFEGVLERGCKVQLNGHHVAGEFSQLFQEYSFKEQVIEPQ